MSNLIPQAECANIIGKTPQYIYKLRMQGKIKTYRNKTINLKEVQSLDIKSQKESIMKEKLLPIDKNNSNEIKGY